MSWYSPSASRSMRRRSAGGDVGPQEVRHVVEAGAQPAALPVDHREADPGPGPGAGDGAGPGGGGPEEHVLSPIVAVDESPGSRRHRREVRPDPRPQRLDQPARPGREAVAEAFQHHRQAHQKGDLQEAGVLRTEDVGATRQGRVIDRAPELPVQPRDLADGAPRPPRLDAGEPGRHLEPETAQVLEHQDESVRVFIEVAVQEGRRPDAGQRREAAIEQALALVHRQPPGEPESRRVGGGQLDDDARRRRAGSAGGGQMTAQEPAERIGRRPEVLDRKVLDCRKIRCAARRQRLLHPVGGNRVDVVAKGRAARHVDSHSPRARGPPAPGRAAVPGAALH